MLFFDGHKKWGAKLFIKNSLILPMFPRKSRRSRGAKKRRRQKTIVNKQEEKQSPVVAEIAFRLCEYGPGWRKTYREMVSILSPILQGSLARLCAGYLSGGPSHLVPFDMDNVPDWAGLGICDHCFRSVKKFQVFMQRVWQWDYLYQIVCDSCLWPSNRIMSGVHHVGGK